MDACDLLLTGDLVLDVPDADYWLSGIAAATRAAQLTIGHLEVPHTRGLSVLHTDVPAPGADPDNLFVTGQSGGGVLTAWSVGHTPRFRAAASQSPVVDWTSWVVTADVYAHVVRNWFEQPPWKDEAIYWRQSPLAYVNNVTTPTLVIDGDQDLRTTLGQAEEFYQALQLRNVPTALVVIPGASHAVFSPSQMVAQMSAILAWFERYKHVGP